MSVVYTRQDLITQVVANLRKLGNDVAPQAEDNEKVDKIVDASFARLSSGPFPIYTVGDPGLQGPTDGAIEAVAFLDLATVVTHDVAPRFNMAGNPVLAASYAEAIENLKLISAPPQTLKTLRVESSLLPERRRGTYIGD